MRTKVQKNKTAWKLSLVGLIMAACFLIALPTLNAQQSQQGQQGYGGQQEQQGYGGEQGQQGQQGYGGEQGQQGQQQYQEPSQKKAEDFSDSELENFAAAQSKVDDVRGEYSDELSGVEDPGKAQELQSKYTEKMINEIEETGLSVSDYNNISSAIQQNPKLQKKVDKMGN